MQELITKSAFRKKNSERTEPTGPGNEGLSNGEEDLVANTDEESEDEGKEPANQKSGHSGNRINMVF